MCQTERETTFCMVAIVFSLLSHFKEGPFFVSEQTTATGVLPVLVIKADNSLGTSP